FGLYPGGKKAIVPDLTVAFWQYMQEEAGNELFSCQGAGFFAVFFSVQVRKGDCFFIHCQYPVVANGNLMGIPAQVFHYGGRLAKGFFGIDHPLFFVKSLLELPEMILMLQLFDLSLQAQIPCLIVADELFHKLSLESFGQCLHMEEELSAAFGVLPFSIR